MRKALIHDWYYVNGGAEKVIRSLNNIWDDFDHFALIDFLPESERSFIFSGKSDWVKTSFIQHLPTARSNHRKFLQLFPMAIEQFNLRDYELVFSSSSSIAKGVKTHTEQMHISYIHSPMRYAWDLYHQYMTDLGYNSGIKGWYVKKVLNSLRSWDLKNSHGVDHMIANSKHVAKRIKNIYNRDATVIYPPVDIDKFTLETNKEDYFLTGSRMVSYKKIDMIVEAFSTLKDKKLIVLGDGPEMDRIKLKATPNIEILGHVPSKDFINYMQKARAFIFAAEEDFGIVPVEAQACGTPVIAFGKGGALETVKLHKSGLFFYDQTATAIIGAISDFEKHEFDPEIVRENSLKFNRERFEKEIKDFIDLKLDER